MVSLTEINNNNNNCRHNCEQCSEKLSGKYVLKCDECDYTVCSDSCLKNYWGFSHISKCDNCDTIVKSEDQLNEHV